MQTNGLSPLPQQCLDLGSLIKEIGGDQVSVFVFAKGPEHPHFVEVKPNFIRVASKADLYVEVGMESEIGWSPCYSPECP
ncbi:MAG: metal ABC transporter substrate-binding protein [Comamonadaceae bacterium]|nr:metal ABC transporter substrate-binding protein [Comamonadaceae bacterium]